MTKRNIVSLSPLRKAHICFLIVRFSYDRVDEPIARVGCFPLGVERIAPIAMSSFPIRIDGDCLCEPDTRSIESIAPKLRISRLVTFLELHITGVQRGFVKMRV